MVGESKLNSTMKGNCVARALYDNAKESPDELAFRKGDLLTVLEQNTAGLEGWWLCSLRGMQGICPGNRLRIIPGCYDTGSGLTTLSAVQSSAGHINTGGGLTYQRNQTNKVVTPRRVGDIFAYDTPKSHHPLHSDFEFGAMRRSQDGSLDGSRLSRSSSLRCDSPRTNFRGSLEQYDTPKPQESQYDSPSSRPLYDLPKSSHQQTFYDSPKPVCNADADDRDPSAPRSLIKGIRGGLPSTPKPCANQNQNAQEYDIPRPVIHLEGDQDATDRSSKISLMSCDSHLSTSSSASSLQASESLSLSSIGEGSSNRSSLESHDLYDVPPEPRKFLVQQQRPKLPPREGKDNQDNFRSGSLEKKAKPTEEVVYDIPPQVCRDGRPSDTVDSAVKRISSGSECSCTDVELLGSSELPLELDSAKDTLAKLEQDVLLAAERLSNLQKSSKAIQDSPEEVKLGIFKLKESIREFLTFGRGSSVNAFKSGEHKLSSKILKQIEPIDSMYSLICDSWKKLQITPLSTPTAVAIAQEQSAQIASIAGSLNENIHLLNGLIQNNSQLIFKKSPTIESSFSKKIEDEGEKTPVQERPLPEIPTCHEEPEKLNRNEPQAWLEDYDYVNLDSKESLEREHRELLDTLPSQLKKSYDNLFRQSHLTVDNDHKKALKNTSTPDGKRTHLDANDKQVLEFYAGQSKLHLQNLNSAIDAFLLTIENNQPPKVFIAHSKFVILSAHKLVFIGDTVHRNVVAAEVRTHVLNCSNALCDAMKKTVTAAKTAALQFPSVTAVQAMVDAFVSVSHLANSLKRAICRE